MKKQAISGTVLLLGFSSQVFAGTGAANDGILLLISLASVLLLLAGIMAGIDFLRKNGKMMLNRLITSASKLKQLLNKAGTSDQILIPELDTSNTF